MCAAVSVRLATVIITGGVSQPRDSQSRFRFQPILPQEVVPVRHQIWQRVVLLSRSVEVVLYVGIQIYVV